MLQRRLLLGAALASPWARAAGEDAETLLRRGGVVIAFRHSLAPGTFDPPGFRIGDCSTQRNLNDDGRAQARRIGEWFAQRSLKPERVLSSPWCRCVDTATLAFGAPQVDATLGSPRGYSEATNAESLRALRRSLAAASARSGRFEVWVTHMFVLSALVGQGSSSGEGLLLRAPATGAAKGDPEVLARLVIA